MNHPNFSLATSSSGVHQTLFEVKVHKEVVHASRRTRVDLSESKTKNPNQSKSKKNHKPLWFCHFCGRAGHTRPNYFKLQALKKSPKKKCMCQKHKILLQLLMSWWKFLTFILILALKLGQIPTPSLHLKGSRCKRFNLSESV